MVKDALDCWMNLKKNIEIYKLCDFSQQRLNEVIPQMQRLEKAKVFKSKIYPDYDFSESVLISISRVSPFMLEVIHDLFGSMYHLDFRRTSSVNIDIEEDRRDKDYDLCQNIDLFTHSHGVYENMYTLCKQKKYPQHYIDYFLVIALTHDFGKCPRIYKHYESRVKKDSKEVVKHQFISALYVRDFLVSYNERQTDSRFKLQERDIDMVAKTLNNHHANKPADEVLELIDMLNQAEYMTRQQEIATILKAQKAQE